MGHLKLDMLFNFNSEGQGDRTLQNFVVDEATSPAVSSLYAKNCSISLSKSFCGLGFGADTGACCRACAAVIGY
jgi:hypothetical protein